MHLMLRVTLAAIAGGLLHPLAAFADGPVTPDPLAERLRALAPAESRWGAAYQPLYHAALPWYERWAAKPPHTVDDWMVPPAAYAAELAEAMERGRNFFAENPGALVPLAFTAQRPDGSQMEANYWIILPSDFGQPGRTFPLVISLHGTGWLGHKLSFVRRANKNPSGGRVIGVTPINEGGLWDIAFLNAFLDELLRVFPVDPDRVYVDGHSLGAMATWEWALNNPDRFAAISPRAGRGEPYRASRLRHVPAWVIHGADDGDVFPGFSDQMVAALQGCGGRVRYSLLPQVGHNMPADLDDSQVVEWYLRQVRSHEPAPADPREQLGVTAAGYSPTEVISSAPAHYWKSEPVSLADRGACLHAVQALFRQAGTTGALIDQPLLECYDPATKRVTFWLATPGTLRRDTVAPASTLARPAARWARFYFRGRTDDALAHAARVARDARAGGQTLAEEVWITPLSLWPDAPNYHAEYRMEIVAEGAAH